MGAKISPYFSEDFTDSYPLLAESLSLKFSSVTVTSTAVECAFSLANNQVHANNSATTNADKMQHAMSVRGGICRELRSKGAASSRPVNPDTTPKRTYRVHRSARSSHAYFRKILDFREEKLENVPTVTNQSLRVHCKTEKDFELTLGYAISELQCNEGNMTINADILAREIRGFNKSKFEGSFDMPMSPEEVEYNEAKAWKAPDIKTFLINRLSQADPNYKAQKQVINKLRKEEKYEDEVCLISLLIDSWHSDRNAAA